MKRINYLTLAVAALLSACSQLDGDEELSGRPAADGESTVSFTADFQSSTRATETAFENGDEISVFAVKGGTTLQASGNYADNYRYRYADGSFGAVDDGIQLDDQGLAYYAVYPYSADVKPSFTFSAKTDQTTAANRTASDLCTAFAATTTSRQVSLKFSHRQSRVIVRVQGSNLASKKVSVSLTDVQTQTATDLNANTFQGTGSTGTVQMGLASTNTYEAIIAPQTITAGTEFIVVNVDGKEQKFSQGMKLNLTSGKQVEYVVDTDNGVVIGGDINPWSSEGPITQLGEATFSCSALKFYVTACERVGNVVIIDFLMKNTSGRNLTNLHFSSARDWDNYSHEYAIDNLSNDYSNCRLIFGDTFYEKNRDVWNVFDVDRINSGETLQGHIRIKNFESTNTASSVSVWYNVTCGNYDFTNTYNNDKVGVMALQRLPLTDNRVLTDGIQTCDRRLKLAVTGTSKELEYGELYHYVNYTVTNLSDQHIKGFHMHMWGSYTACYDNNGHNASYADQSVNGSQYDSDVTFDLAPGSSTNVTLRVRGFDASSTLLYCNGGCEAENTQIDDEEIRFIAVPLAK